MEWLKVRRKPGEGPKEREVHVLGEGSSVGDSTATGWCSGCRFTSRSDACGGHCLCRR